MIKCKYIKQLNFDGNCRAGGVYDLIEPIVVTRENIEYTFVARVRPEYGAVYCEWLEERRDNIGHRGDEISSDLDANKHYMWRSSGKYTQLNTCPMEVAYDRSRRYSNYE